LILIKHDEQARTSLHTILTIAERAHRVSQRVEQPISIPLPELKAELVPPIGEVCKKILQSGLNLEEQQFPEQQFAPHHTLAKLKSRLLSAAFLHFMNRDRSKGKPTKFLRFGFDSDDEYLGEADVLTCKLNERHKKFNEDEEKNSYPRKDAYKGANRHDSNLGYNPKDHEKSKIHSSTVDSEENTYVDAGLDRSYGLNLDSQMLLNQAKEKDEASQGMKHEHKEMKANDKRGLLDESWGYGRRSCNQMTVLSHLDEDVPMYFLTLDHRKLKISYDPAVGLPVAFLVHKNAVRRLLDKHNKVKFKLYKRFCRTETPPNLTPSSWSTDKNPSWSDDNWREFLDKELDHMEPGKWKPYAMQHFQEWHEGELLTLRSSLLAWLVDLLRSPMPKHDVQWMLGIMGSGKRRKDEKMVKPPSQSKIGDAVVQVNLTIIAKCLARAFPTMHVTKDVRERLLQAWALPSEIEPFIQRKSQYGVYVVKGGVLEQLRALRIQVREVVLGDTLTARVQNNNLNYLDIINKFSDYCCVVYVRGLKRIPDPLLKWLAEFTAAHPWRFVYLENVDMSWNFSENRDRCNFTHAPEMIAHTIEEAGDLDSHDVKMTRPSHEHRYTQYEGAKQDWESINHFWKKVATEDTKDLWQKCSADAAKEYEANFTQKVEENFLQPEPCLILLDSPPGAGKTYLVERSLKEQATDQLSLKYERIDGSSDQLVTHALVDLLQQAVPESLKTGVMLVIDEYHMLTDIQKDELFDWLRGKMQSMHVILIANRIDDFDTRKFEQFGKEGIRAHRISARLTEAKIRQVAEKNKLANIDHIIKWMRCSRLLFGNESLSLRILQSLSDAFTKWEACPEIHPVDLEEILLNKLPTISRVTAHEFTSSVLQALRASSMNKSESNYNTKDTLCDGPISTMVAFAMQEDTVVCSCDKDQECDCKDQAITFPDLMKCLPHAFEAPPAFRLGAWCVYMQEEVLKPKLKTLPPAAGLFRNEFVDQVGFPLQLRTPGRDSVGSGRAFSWNGNYNNLQDIIDASKHGHTINWADAKEIWKDSEVEDDAALVRLVSCVNNPKSCLESLTEKNLCELMDKGTPQNAFRLASEVVQSFWLSRGPHTEECNPFCTAVWTLIRYYGGPNKCPPNSEKPEVHQILKQTADDRQAGQHENQDTTMLFEVVRDSLEWAQRYCQNRKTVESTPSIPDELLTQLLGFVSRHSQAFPATNSDEEGDKSADQCARSAHLWSGIFGKLLIPKSHHGSPNDKMKQHTLIVQNVVVSARSECPTWRSEIKTMYHLANSIANEVAVNSLWKAHRRLLQVVSCDGNVSSDSPIREEFVVGMLSDHVTRLDPELQQHLLTMGCCLPRLEENQVDTLLGPGCKRLNNKHEPATLHERTDKETRKRIETLAGIEF